MKSVSVILLLLTCLSVAYGQNMNWRSVTILEQQPDISYADSLVICGGEAIIKGKEMRIEDISVAKLKKIKKKIARWGCPVVSVQVNHLWDGKRSIFILGLGPKAAITN